MTIASVRSVSSAHESSITPGTHEDEDLILVFVKYGAGTVTIPTDFARLPGAPFLHTTEGVDVFWRIADSNNIGAIALAGGTDHMLGVAVAIQDAHLTKPFHQIVGFRQLGSQTSATGASSSTLWDDILNLDIFAAILDNQTGEVASGEANSDLGSLTQIFDVSTSSGNGGALIGYSGTVAAPDDNVGPTTIGTLVSTAWSGVRIAINPIADKVITNVARDPDGTPRPNGETIRALDVTQPAASGLCTVGTTGGGTGTYTILAPYTDHDYQAVRELGGASVIEQAV
jgi:hypothetical protein